MGAHQNVDGTIQQTFEHLFATFPLYHTGKQGYAQVHILEESHDGLQMLFGQDFGWRHDTGLIAVIDGNQH